MSHDTSTLFPAPLVDLAMRPERRLIRPHGSLRHVDFVLQVRDLPRATTVERHPVAISLVLDRSGSMHGAKIDTARRAAVAVMERLDPRDQVAAVIFDNQVDVLQEAALATPEVKARLRSALLGVEARGNTALHEGWLTGCKVIAATDPTQQHLARCFLLTDGLANEGLTDPEQIAAEAAAIRKHANVGTSTFGIGADYDESLLGPLAVAGGGQFHHLRTPEEIARTFVGELGEMLAVAAQKVRLEVEAAPGTSGELVSAYWLETAPDRRSSWTVDVGDMLSNEERHVVMRFGFIPQIEHPGHQVRARAVWRTVDGADQAGPWQEVYFRYADHAERRAEQADRQTLRVVGLHHAERAIQQAMTRSRHGEVDLARALLTRVRERIQEYAGDDPELQAAIARLRNEEQGLREVGYSPLAAKEVVFGAYKSMRSQKDLR